MLNLAHPDSPSWPSVLERIATLEAELSRYREALPLCGGSESVINFGVGCGKQIESLHDLYRCATCDVPMHLGCLRRHFYGTEDGPLPTRVEEIAKELLAKADAKLAQSYPATPVDCLLSTLSEIEAFPHLKVGGAAAIRKHVLDAVAECRAALAGPGGGQQ